jgi:hypothetical protein
MEGTGWKLKEVKGGFVVHKFVNDEKTVYVKRNFNESEVEMHEIINDKLPDFKELAIGTVILSKHTAIIQDEDNDYIDWREYKL